MYVESATPISPSMQVSNAFCLGYETSSHNYRVVESEVIQVTHAYSSMEMTNVSCLGFDTCSNTLGGVESRFAKSFLEQFVNAHDLKLEI